MTVIFYSDANKEWRWRVKAVNGRVIADSGEGYKNLADALKIFNKLTGTKNFKTVVKGSGTK